MVYIDVFNGDADGLCGLHQLRLHDPRPDVRLLSGVKRETNLLSRLDGVANSYITVLDISLDNNRDQLRRLLDLGNNISYFDHHYSGDIPVSDRLKTYIDPTPQTCTSFIVDKEIKSRYKQWALVGAFGDNLDEVAYKEAEKIKLKKEETEKLKEVGVLLNYNGYGATVEDLFFHPEELYQLMRNYKDPLQFHAESNVITTLRLGYEDDMSRACSCQPILENQSCRVFQLPAEPWARRVGGVFSNNLAREQKNKGHALITPNNDGSWRISVRAPLNNRVGADNLCRLFPTGGGRAAAAGINSLPSSQLDKFLEIFSGYF